MSLADVQFQPQAHRLIQRAIVRERVPHAYIFHGPDGVGKELLARGLAQLLLCTDPVERPAGWADGDERVAGQGPGALSTMRMGCGACEDCCLAAAGTHPDWHLIYRQLNRDHPDPAVRRRKALEIGVDVLRHFVIEKVGHTPMRGRAKVFVIREADRITTQAQNALLKTLEEPPGTTFIVLLVSSLDRLLPTTLSRCQLIGFDALPTVFVRRRLIEHRGGLTPDQVDWYASVAQGSIGAALEAAGDELFEVNERLLASLSPLEGESVRSEPSVSARATKPGTPSLNGGVTIKLWTDLAGELGNRYRKRDPDISNTEATRRGLKTVMDMAAAWYADVLRIQVGPAKVPIAIADDNVMAVGCEDEAGDPSQELPHADDSMSLFGPVKESAPAPKSPTKKDAAGGTRKRVAKAEVGGEVPPGGAGLLVNRAWSSALERVGDTLSPEAAMEAVKRIARAEQQLDRNANTQLVVEVLLNDLALIQDGEHAIVV